MRLAPVAVLAPGLTFDHNLDQLCHTLLRFLLMIYPIFK
jgi:hypothetical protein